MVSSKRQATSRATLCIAALLMVVTACGKKDANADASGTAAGTPAATPANNVSVGDVKLGSAVDANGRVTDDKDEFKTGDTIYASVDTKGASPSSTLQARWTFEDGQIVDSTTRTIAPTGDATTEFHIVKPGGWPKGKYKLTVLLNGAEAKTKEFKVN